MNICKPTWVIMCAFSLALCACHKAAPSLTGVFAGTIEIDRAFSQTIPFGQQINLPIVIRNPRKESLTFENVRMPTSWKSAYKGSGSSSGTSVTLPIDAKSGCLVFCRFYVGPATDNVDAMRFTKVDFGSPVGGEHILFRHEDGDIDLTVNLQFTIDGQDSGRIPIARYRIEQRKNRAVPASVALDLRKRLDTADLKLCDLWRHTRSSR